MSVTFSRRFTKNTQRSHVPNTGVLVFSIPHVRNSSFSISRRRTNPGSIGFAGPPLRHCHQMSAVPSWSSRKSRCRICLVQKFPDPMLNTRLTHALNWFGVSLGPTREWTAFSATNVTASVIVLFVSLSILHFSLLRDCTICIDIKGKERQILC